MRDLVERVVYAEQDIDLRLRIEPDESDDVRADDEHISRNYAVLCAKHARTRGASICSVYSMVIYAGHARLCGKTCDARPVR